MREPSAAHKSTIDRSRTAIVAAAAMLTLLSAGCGHRQQTAARKPQTAPHVKQAAAAANEYPPGDSGAVGVNAAGVKAALDLPRPALGNSARPSARIAPTPVPVGGVDEDDMEFITTHQPVTSEEGLATWYSAPYKGRKAANGEVFDDEALTAAHRTLPMGSLVVVTNLKTGQSSPMRITDRGPFVEGRILDMTMASARATGVYTAGLVNVRVDVYRTPKPMETGGRWCVQIGAFHKEHEALKLQSKLEDEYPDANVIEFAGTDSYWVRIRPAGDNREVAERITKRLRLKDPDASPYLTRLD